VAGAASLPAADLAALEGGWTGPREVDGRPMEGPADGCQPHASGGVLLDQRTAARAWTRAHGEDSPEVTGWTWPA
jgi:hypothetical protein